MAKKILVEKVLCGNLSDAEVAELRRADLGFAREPKIPKSTIVLFVISLIFVAGTFWLAYYYAFGVPPFYFPENVCQLSQSNKTGQITAVLWDNDGCEVKYRNGTIAGYYATNTIFGQIPWRNVHYG